MAWGKGEDGQLREPELPVWRQLKCDREDKICPAKESPRGARPHFPPREEEGSTPVLTCEHVREGRTATWALGRCLRQGGVDCPANAHMAAIAIGQPLPKFYRRVKRDCTFRQFQVMVLYCWVHSRKLFYQSIRVVECPVCHEVLQRLLIFASPKPRDTRCSQ